MQIKRKRQSQRKRQRKSQRKRQKKKPKKKGERQRGDTRGTGQPTLRICATSLHTTLFCERLNDCARDRDDAAWASSPLFFPPPSLFPRPLPPLFLPSSSFLLRYLRRACSAGASLTTTTRLFLCVWPCVTGGARWLVLRGGCCVLRARCFSPLFPTLFNFRFPFKPKREDLQYS